MRAVCYARVSSAAQKERHTIASQLRTLPEFIAARGWTLARPADTYVDDGRTAKAGNLEARDGFRRLLVDAAAGAFDVVVVVDLDRLTRSEDLTERGAVLGAFQRAGVKLAIASSGQILDLSSSMGDLYSGLQAFFAAEENRKRRERTIRGKIEAAMKGRKPSGPTPYGYAYDRETGVWSVDEDAAAVVRECFARVAAGESCYRLAVELEERAVPRPRSGHWHRGRVFQIITQPGYLGRMTVDKARALNVAVPALVDAETWHRAQSMLPAARRLVPRAPRSKRWNLIEGIAVCGECGEKVQITGSGRGQRYYCCADKKRVGRNLSRCPNRMRPVEALDAMLWGEIRKVVERPDLLEETVASRRQMAETGTDWAAELAGYERQLAALERAEAVILDRFRRGKVSEGAMDREVTAAARQRKLLERNRDLARQELAASRRTAEEAEALAVVASRLLGYVEAATPEERQKLARAFIPGLTLWRDRVEFPIRLIPMGEPVFRASAASSNAERSEDAAKSRLFRVVLKLAA